VLGLKMIIPFPLKFIRGLCFWVFVPVMFWEFLYILLGAFCGSLIVRV
jgi:hypothetical protein